MILYRFRPFNQHTITELLTQKLHFSHPSTWNDPFEFEFIDRKDMDGGSRYSCFATNKNDEEKDMLQNILMWSHYAESHKGICIEYECEYTLVGDIHINSISYKVKYSSQNAYSPTLLSFFSRKDAEHPKGSKEQCWNYENEYRIMSGKMYANTNFQGVNIPYGEIALKIKAIYCGVKFEEFETLQIIRGKQDFEIFKSKPESYSSIKFEKLETITQ